MRPHAEDAVEQMEVEGGVCCSEPADSAQVLLGATAPQTTGRLPVQVSALDPAQGFLSASTLSLFQDRGLCQSSECHLKVGLLCPSHRDKGPGRRCCADARASLATATRHRCPASRAAYTCAVVVPDPRVKVGAQQTFSLKVNACDVGRALRGSRKAAEQSR